MAISRKSNRSKGSLNRRLRRIEEEERKYRRIMEEAADPRPVLPPPDELRRSGTAMRRLHVDAALPRQMVRHEKRVQFASLLLFVALSVATIAAGMWMLRLAQM